MMLKRVFAAGAIAVSAVFGYLPGAQAAPIAVDLELILAADVSGSLDIADFNLQRDGYVAAFQSAAVKSAIASGTLGRIAVTLVYWSINQVQSVGWTLIDSAASADAFAAAIGAAARPFSGGTGMTDAVNFSSGLFGTNGFEAARQTIDISGDGSESIACSSSTFSCAPLQAARNAYSVGAPVGVVRAINAIWIDDRNFFGDDVTDAIQAVPYGLENVVTANHSFTGIVQDFGTFSDAIRTKLVAEIIVIEVPEPATLPLIGAALLGLLAIRRRRAA